MVWRLPPTSSARRVTVPYDLPKTAAALRTNERIDSVVVGEALEVVGDLARDPVRHDAASPSTPNCQPNHAVIPPVRQSRAGGGSLRLQTMPWAFTPMQHKLELDDAEPIIHGEGMMGMVDHHPHDS